MSPKDISDLYANLLDKYPLKLLDGLFAEDDWKNWTAFTNYPKLSGGRHDGIIQLTCSFAPRSIKLGASAKPYRRESFTSSRQS